MKHLETAYKLLPPPLAALPAKYHAPLSLGLHSLSTGYVAYRIAELAEFDDYKELVFVLGLTHDMHQKLVHDGLTTLKTAKEYIKEKLDELGYRDYYRFVDNALELDMCGKENPVKGLPKELATICHIGDMAQGRIEAYALLYWLRDKVGSISKDLTVRFYSVMIPQPFARAYAMLRIYNRYIADTEHLALASPWGLYVITYEDELPEVLEVSWDDLRIDPIIDYREIVKAEEAKKSVTLNNIKLIDKELRNKMWSKFARMFYRKDKVDSPIYPVLHQSIEGLFVNIAFTDVEFKTIDEGQSYRCALCGSPSHEDYVLVTNMYGKVAGVNVTTEKWNRFMPAHIWVKAWDSKDKGRILGQIQAKIGLCPLCTLDAVALRKLGFSGKINGFISLSIPKPIPIELLKILGQSLRDRKEINEVPVSTGTHDGVVLDYNTATVSASIDVPEPKTENMFSRKDGKKVIMGELVYLGRLLALGFYPLKFLRAIDTSVPDRLLVLPVSFQALDFPVTSKEYSSIVPWVVKLVEVAGSKERSEGMEVLMDKPVHVPLHLLSLDKSAYDSVSSLLREIGVRP